LILYLRGFDVNQFFCLDDYYDSDRPAYYKALQSVKPDILDLTNWLEYFVEGGELEKWGQASQLHIFFFCFRFTFCEVVKPNPRNLTEPLPIIEFILSGCFSILVFSYVNVKENKMLCFYYGMISGFLFYIILYGFPYLF